MNPVLPGGVTMEADTKLPEGAPRLQAIVSEGAATPRRRGHRGSVDQKYLMHQAKEGDLDNVIILGQRGSVQSLLGAYFEDQKRSCITNVIRRGAVALITATGLGCCYITKKHILVEDDQVALSFNNGVAEMLGPGRHVLMSPLNTDCEIFQIGTPHYHKGPLHVVNVSDDQIGLAFEQGTPVLLGPGMHCFNSPFFEFTGFALQTQQVICHGTFNRIIVQEGTVGMAWEGNTPMLLPPGIYQITSPLFHFVKAQEIDNQEVDLEPFFIITVHDGQVGISYDRGVLNILGPGEHWLNRQENQKFLDFLPTTQQVRELKVLDVLTSDGLMVRIKGSVTFRINNPELAVINIGSEASSAKVGGSSNRKTNITMNLFSTIMRRANDTLASLLTGTEVLSSGGLGMASTTVSAPPHQPGSSGPEKIISPGDAHAMDQRQRGKKQTGQHTKELNTVISHRFKESLTATLQAEWGVELREMNVVDIQVMDEKVRGALADGVRANIEAVTDRRNAEAKADTVRIMAKGESDELKLKTDAKVYEIEERAKAEQKAGKLLETTPVAVQIRLAESASKAIQNGKSSLLLCKDASTNSLLNLIGAAGAVTKMS